MCDFLGRPLTPACRDYLEGQVNPAKIAQFRHADAGQIAEVQAAIAPTLARLEYLPRAA
ncbi:MAG: hypothetical protein GTO62_03605 [Planctomycetales bacterium]|nr:hypothetical protein [Planctomycetales bacterium]NIP68314.1 hypothetical protein [Planctomycetales bacterium]